MTDKKQTIHPNAMSCEGCPQWDDVNGCWMDRESPFGCPKCNDGEYDWSDDE